MSEPCPNHYTKGMNSELVRERFSEIQAFRATGKSWKAIASRLFGEDSDEAADLLGRYFRREMRRQSDPDLLAASDWVKAHRKEITKMLRAGESWFQIGHALGSPIPLATSKGLKMVAGEYYRTSSGSPKKVKEPTQPQSKATPLLPAPALDVSAGQSISVATEQKPDALPQAQAASATEQPQTPEPTELDVLRQEIAKNKNPMPMLLRGEKMAPEHFPKFLRYAAREWAEKTHEVPEYDPEIPVDAFDEELADLQRAYKSLCSQLRNGLVPEEEIERVDKHTDQVKAQIEYIKAVRAYRCPNPQAMFAEISTIATVAMDCGVFRVCEADEPGAIELRGYDRPAGEYPNPVYIIENYTDEEAATIKDVHAKDPFERGMTPKRRLGEALCVRGVVSGDPILDPDTYPHLNVRFEGEDFISPWLLPSKLLPLSLLPLNLREASVGFVIPLVPEEARRTTLHDEPVLHHPNREQILQASIERQERLARARAMEQQVREADSAKQAELEAKEREAKEAEQSDKESSKK